MTKVTGRSTLGLPFALDPEQVDRWRRVGPLGGMVFLDYDGTLTPIVDRPEQAILSGSMRQTLLQLAQKLPVAIVSGRDIDVVADLVRVDHLAYVGSHGLDIVGPPGSGLRKEVALEFVPVLDKVEHELKRRTEDVAGVVVERKRFSVSTHVRLVASDERERVDAIVDALQREQPTLRREAGKMLFELRPDIDWDKGHAVCWLLDAMGRTPSEALFIGDDLTDETVFRSLTSRGVGIVVAETRRPTSADLRLGNVQEVERLLERLTAAASGP